MSDEVRGFTAKVVTTTTTTPPPVSKDIKQKMIDNGPPQPPMVIPSSKTTDSITFKLVPREDDIIEGFIVHYKHEFGGWKDEKFKFITEEYILRHLWCGSQYQIYVVAFNS